MVWAAVGLSTGAVHVLKIDTSEWSGRALLSVGPTLLLLLQLTAGRDICYGRRSVLLAGPAVSDGAPLSLMGHCLRPILPALRCWLCRQVPRQPAAASAAAGDG